MTYGVPIHRSNHPGWYDETFSQIPIAAGETYQLRLPIPKDIQHRIGRSELRWSLETKIKRIAEYRTWKAAVYFTKICDSIRSMPELSEIHIKDLVQGFFEHLKASFESPPAMSSFDNFHYKLEQDAFSEEAVSNWLYQLETRNFDDEIKNDLEQLMTAKGMKLSNLEPEQQYKLLNGVTRARIEFQRFVAERLADPLSEYIPNDELFNSPISYHTQTPPPPHSLKPQSEFELNSGHTVKALADQFIERGEKMGYNDGTPWKSATCKLYRRALPWFVELLGENCDIKHVTKEHVKRIRDILLLRPAGLSSTTSVLDIPEADKEKRVSSTTARNEFGTILKFLRWCEHEGFIDSAPVNVQPIVKAKALEQNKKRPFEPSELNKYFSSPLFSGCKNRINRHLEGPHRFKDELFWASLLLLYTGARTGGIAALYVEDVRIDNDIPYLKFQMRDGNLKEIESERETPIHPDLIEFGFKTFVEIRKQKDPMGKLFGRLEKKLELRETLNKKLNNYRHNIGLKIPGLGMHSFRHGMIDALVNAEVPEAIAERFVGHKISTVHAKYGKGLNLESQYKFLLKLDLKLTEETKDILRKPANV